MASLRWNILRLHSKQKLRMYQKRFEKYDLIIADELGYISFDREAADLLCNR